METSIIPIEIYTALYYNVIFAFVLITFFHSQLLKMDDKRNKAYIRVTGFILFSFVLLYMGFRPVSGFFGDMLVYDNYFNMYQNNYEITETHDVLFHQFMMLCTKFMTAESFFFICAALYIAPLWYLSKKWFGNLWFYSFLMLVGSFSFWVYGVNGIRNGLATSLMLMAFTFIDKKIIMSIFIVLACSFHSTMLLPAVALVLTFLNNKPKIYLAFWLITIPASLVLGGFWESMFAGLGFADDRVSNLTSGNVEGDNFSSTGFRWDFILYSFSGVYTGWYFIVKQKFQDVLYSRLLNVFLFTNGIWILVIRANFSNRFAYLSWFMLGIIIIYPFLKLRNIRHINIIISFVLLVYFMFTYFMNFIKS